MKGEGVLQIDRRRRRLVKDLTDLALNAGRVVLYGPWGIGKTTILLETARAVRAAGARVGYCARTGRLADVVAALEQVHDDVPTIDLSAKRRKSSLRAACDREAALLLMDGFHARGSALVGFLRSLRGKRLSVIAAADVESPRDLAAVRAIGVAHRELAVPLLAPRELGRHLDRLAEAMPLPFALTPAARRALLRLARGCPGVLERAWARLRESRYWQGDAPLVETIRADLHLEWLADTRDLTGDVGRLN